MKIEDIRHIINRNKDDISFIVGNGINRYYKSAEELEWKELLLELWDKYVFSTQSIIPDGISFTEFYDILELNNGMKNDNFQMTLQKDIKEKMLNWKGNRLQNKIFERIKKIDAPLLTANFDQLIPDLLDLDFYKIDNSKFTDFYPWSSYYSHRKLNNPLDGFGVWYINGMVKYHRSIKLGLSQYMGNVYYARNMIHNTNEASLFSGKDQVNWAGVSTWLHILFNKSIFIFGFSLDEQEIFVRWLLIERAKYFRKFPERKHKGWFLVRKGSLSDGKKLFFNSVGIEILEVDSYENMYEDIWQ